LGSIDPFSTDESIPLRPPCTPYGASNRPWPVGGFSHRLTLPRPQSYKYSVPPIPNPSITDTYPCSSSPMEKNVQVPVPYKYLTLPYLTYRYLKVTLLLPVLRIPVITDGKGTSVLSVITDHQSLLTTSRLYSSVYNFWLMTCYSPPRGPITCNFLPPSIHSSIPYFILHTPYSVLHTLYSIILHTSHFTLHTSHLSLLPLISNCD
jgi:hypothetical protein